ncbi:hypothetical protein ACUJ7H_004516 [Escherichia coli]
MKEIDLLYENIYQLLIKPYLLDLSSQSGKKIEVNYTCKIKDAADEIKGSMIFNDVDGKQKAICTIRVLILKTFHDGRYRFVIESVIYDLINNYSGFILTGRLFWQGEGFGHELFPVTNKYNAWRWKNKKIIDISW